MYAGPTDTGPENNIHFSVQHDFCLDKKPVQIESEGTDNLQMKDNQLTATITNEDFCITVKGFDQNRDLLIKPVVKEMEVADAEA